MRISNIISKNVLNNLSFLKKRTSSPKACLKFIFSESKDKRYQKKISGKVKNSDEFVVKIIPRPHIIPPPSAFCKSLETKMKEGDGSWPVLSRIYGNRLADEIFQAFNWPKNKMLSRKECALFCIAMAARVKVEDLKELLNSIASEPVSKNHILYSLLDKKEFSQLLHLSTKAFETLNDKEIDQVVQFFRKERLLKIRGDKELDLSQERIEDIKILLHPDQHISFQQDVDFLNVTQQWKNYSLQNEHPYTQTDRAFAISEICARYYAYYRLHQGALLPLPHPMKSSSPVYFQAEGGIEQKSFACGVISGVSADFAHEIRILPRGTEMDNPSSVAANLGIASGIVTFKRYRYDMLDLLKNACDKVPEGKGIDLYIHGHSMGGGHSQHFTSFLAKEIKTDLKSKRFQPWGKLRRVIVKNWNSPAVTKKQARRFADNLQYMSTHPAATQIVFDLTYLRVSYDLVQRFGEVFLGFFRKSNNINIKVVYYPLSSYVPFLGPHIAPIHKSREKGSEPLLIKEDDRSAAYQRQKELEILSYIITEYRLSKELALYFTTLSEQQQKLMNRFSAYKIQDLEKLLVDSATKKLPREAAALEFEKKNFIHHLELLIVKQHLAKAAHMAEAYSAQYPLWFKK